MDEIAVALPYRESVQDARNHMPSAPRVIAVVGPLILAVFAVFGTFGASEGQPESRDLDALAIVLVLAGPTSLLFLRRNLLAVLWFVTGVTLCYLLRGYAYGPVMASLVIVLIQAVLCGHRYAAWAAAGVVYVGHFMFRTFVSDEGWSWGPVLGVGAWTLVILVVGEVVRVRRERVVADRQAYVETERRQANEERLRIARELHDVVAHHMSLINVQAGVALHLFDRRPEQAQTALAAIKTASKEALGEMRALVGVLREEAEAAPRAPADMLGSLDGLIERSGHAGLAVRKQVDGDERPLPASVELTAFRIIQEAITNVVRHSGGRTADIRLDYGAHVLTVQVVDDGTGGTRVGSLEEGRGIRGMRERVAALGGTLTVDAAPSGGLRLRAALPLGGDA